MCFDSVEFGRLCYSHVCTKYEPLYMHSTLTGDLIIVHTSFLILTEGGDRPKRVFVVFLKAKAHSRLSTTPENKLSTGIVSTPPLKCHPVRHTIATSSRSENIWIITIRIWVRYIKPYFPKNRNPSALIKCTNEVTLCVCVCRCFRGVQCQ